MVYVLQSSSIAAEAFSALGLLDSGGDRGVCVVLLLLLSGDMKLFVGKRRGTEKGDMVVEDLDEGSLDWNSIPPVGRKELY